MAGNKHQLARLSRALGVTHLLERLPRRPSLLVLNYHRIGDPSATPFDSGVFSCNAQDLERQVVYLKRHFRIVGLPEAVDILDGRTALTEPTVLLSFDDGYLDNYQLAFPVLDRHHVPAAFFLPTSFIGTGNIPWWDAVASVIKQSSRTSIQISTPHSRTFRLTPPHRERSIREILDTYKSAVVTDTESFFAEIQAACDVPRPVHATAGRIFMNWDEAREMQAAGMSFGSHSHTHRILSKLPFHEQHEELRISRKILEHELGRTIDTFAYPVGDHTSYNADTLRALTETGYCHAFSFISGVNRPPAVHRFQILRTGIFSGSLSLLRIRSSLTMLSARRSSPTQTPVLSHLSPHV